MHMSRSFSGALNVRESTLDFLWLELTNRCNLQCVHCYTDSHPHSGDRDILTKRDYESLMIQAYELGCRKLQFIGGEPQLNTAFYPLLIKAKTVGFEFIEIFSNLTRLGAPDCAPDLSPPQREIYPDSTSEPEPVEECPQSCGPVSRVRRAAIRIGSNDA
jgi:uncharacterized radical SAM superfamily Fe-S cluster-containing enzyme